MAVEKIEEWPCAGDLYRQGFTMNANGNFQTADVMEATSKWPTINSKGQTMKIYGTVGSIVCAVAVCWCASAGAQSEMVSSSITLNGESSGGVLTIMKSPGRNYPYVAVTNQAGESAASVIAKLAHQLINSPVCAKYYGGRGVVKEVNGNTIRLLGGPHTWKGQSASTWILGGSEAGFGIPQPPRGLSARREAGDVRLEWFNPAAGYDSVTVLYNGMPRDTLPGTPSNYSHRATASERKLFSSGVGYYCVVGYKDGTPSNGATIRLNADGKLECVMNVPFTQGVAPGFEKWEQKSGSGSIEFEQGTLPGMSPGTDVWDFKGDGFYQIIKTSGSTTGGVFRRFAGLKPGHAYRISAGIRSVEMHGGHASVSIHAAHNARRDVALTSAQLAGVAELPDNSKDSEAGPIARFDRSKLVNGTWERSSTNTGYDTIVGAYSLPKSADQSAVTVWLKVEGDEESRCEIRLDSLAISDMGPM